MVHPGLFRPSPSSLLPLVARLATMALSQKPYHRSILLPKKTEGLSATDRQWVGDIAYLMARISLD